MTTRRAFGFGLISMLLARPSFATALPMVMTYRNPGCGCCEKWAAAMEQAGFQVMMHEDAELDARRAKLGVPAPLAGCHTSVVGEYVIEGHVPPDDVILFLAGKPNSLGLAVAGMPQGSPGMEGGAVEAYEVIEFGRDGSQKSFAKHA